MRHAHECGCGKRWTHTARSDWTAAQHRRAHTCPSCGKHVTLVAMRTMTKAQSKRRIAALRRQGYRVKQVRMPNGDLVILRSKRKHHHVRENPPGLGAAIIVAAVTAAAGALAVYLVQRATAPKPPPLAPKPVLDFQINWPPT